MNVFSEHSSILAATDELGIAGFLVREDVAGIPFTRLIISFDVTKPTEGNKIVRLHDDVLKDHPERFRFLRMVFELFKPSIEAMGKRILIVHECDKGLVILTGEHENSGSVVGHADAPLKKPSNARRA